MICLTRHRLSALMLAVTLPAALVLADPAAAKSKPAKSEKRDEYALKEPVGQAVLALVSLKDQRVTVYDSEGAILSAPVSSGQFDYETPVGIYAVLQKEAEHYSNRYDDAAMPHMQRITWSGVALHGGALPGYPASHGCVRLPYKFAERLFPLTNLGMRVIVSRNNVAPVPISHPLLFKRTPYHEGAGLVTKTAAAEGVVALGPPKAGDPPPDVAERAAVLKAIAEKKATEAAEIDKKAEPARQLVKQRTADNKQATKALSSAEKAFKNAQKRVEDAERSLSRAKSEKATKRAEAAKAKAEAKLAEAQAKLDKVKAEAQPKIDAYQEADEALKAIEAERDAALAEAEEAKRQLAPVSVFISLKTQKLYVRQGFQPVFETPVTIADPAKPIGTHTYTAVAYGEGGRNMRWTVVSIAGRQAGDYDDYGYGSGYEDDYEYDEWGSRRRRHRQARTASEPTPTDLAAATAALDRITIPEDVMQRISEQVLPGTSLIISDEEAHKETGKQTDFVVLISGEPQGGIKKRPRQMNPYYDDFYSYGDYDQGYSRRRGRRSYGGFIFPW